MEERARLFALLDQLAERRAGGRRDYVADYDRTRAARIKLAVVEREDGDEAALRFIEEHDHLHEFRQRLVELHLEYGDLAEAKRQCVDWLETQPPDWRGIRAYYLDTLLAIAQQKTMPLRCCAWRIRFSWRAGNKNTTS